MRTENWAILLLGFMIPLFVLMFWHTNVVSSQTYNDTRYETILSNADQTAVSMVKKTVTPVFQEEEARADAIQAFTESFNVGFNYGKMRENMKDMTVPFILLVDTDGYYVNYTRNYSKVGSYVPEESKRITSALQTYSRSYGDYRVRFYLNDTITVTDKEGMTRTGTRKKLVGIYGNDARDKTSPLWFLHSEDSFQSEKTDVVLGTLEDEINYYVEFHNDNNKHDFLYKFQIPRDMNGYNARYLSEPSIISFVQGYSMVNGKDHVNTFALTGATLQDAKRYNVESKNGRLYYHEKGCSDADPNHIIKKNVTMREAADLGAYPGDCVK